MTYELLRFYQLEDLNTKINERLQDGWVLYGNVIVDGNRFFQAVVKETT